METFRLSTFSQLGKEIHPSIIQHTRGAGAYLQGSMDERSTGKHVPY